MHDRTTTTVPTFRARRIRWALLVSLALLLVTPTAWARTPGSGDDDYGVGGFAIHESRSGADFAVDAAVLPDGRTVVLSAARRAGNDRRPDLSWAMVTRLLPDGTLDPTFGDGGSVELDLWLFQDPAPRGALVVSADGSVTVFGLEAGIIGSNHLVAVRLTSSGQLDQGWSGDATGSRRIPVRGSGLYRVIGGVDAGGAPVFQVSRGVDGAIRVYQYRVVPTLELDPGFGIGGELPAAPGVVPRFQDDQGRWLAAGVYRDDRSRLVVHRLRHDGSLDPTFGVGGVASVPLPNHPGVGDLPVGQVGTDVVVVGAGRIVRLDEEGLPRPAFGDQGQVPLEDSGNARILDVAGRLVVLTPKGGPNCPVARAFGTTGAAALDWADADGRRALCLRPGADHLVDAVPASDGFRVLTTSFGTARLDDAVVVGAYDGAGRVAGSFGDGGQRTLRFADEGKDRAVAMALLPGGGARIAVTTPDGPGVLQVDAHGAADPAFGREGFALTTEGPEDVVAMVVLGDGRTVLAGSGGFVAFTASGAIDRSFGDDGVVAEDAVRALIQLSDGRLVAAAGSRFLGFLPDGRPDPTFGVEGTAPVPRSSGRDRTAVSLAPRGSGFLAAVQMSGSSDLVAFTATGQPDPSFSSAAPSVRSGPSTPPRLLVAPSGVVYLASSGRVYAIAPDGSSASLIVSGVPFLGRVTGMAVDGAGRLVIGTSNVTRGIRLARFLSSGAVDTTFGQDGTVRIAPRGGDRVTVAALAIDGHDRVLVAGEVVVSQDDEDVVVGRFDGRVAPELPTVSVLDVTFPESDAPLPIIAVPLELDRPSAVPIDVTIEVTPGTATEGEDYSSSPVLEVTIPAGRTSWRLYIAARGDDEVEGDETFTVRIVGADQADLGRTTATVTIQDDDAHPVARSTRVLSGADRIGTSVAISQNRFAGGPACADCGERTTARAVVLARADHYADALTGSPLAVKLSAPVLLTAGSNLDPRVLAEARRILPPGGTVHLLGGTASIGPEVEGALAGAGFEVVRHAGADRYATAAAIAGAIGEVSRPSGVLLVTGRDFPDGLAAGAAARGRSVVLLTDGPVLPSATTAFLAAHPDLPVTAIGGPAAQALPSAHRIVGADRYATALAVATELFPHDTPIAGLASGEVFPDALAGGASLVGRGPLLLTPKGAVPPAVATHLRTTVVDRLYVFGGPAVIDPAAFAGL